MRGTRPLRCLFVLALTVATQASIAPLLPGGPDTLDIPLVALLWFALIDRLGRVLALAAALVALRVSLGVSSPVEAALPLIAAITFVRVARNGVDPRDPGRRIALVIGALLAASATSRALWSIPYPGSIDDTAAGLLVGAIAAAVLFPLLDRLVPTLRSATHPL